MFYIKKPIKNLLCFTEFTAGNIDLFANVITRIIILNNNNYKLQIRKGETNQAGS